MIAKRGPFLVIRTREPVSTPERVAKARGGQGDEPFDRSIDIRIARLRRKIERDLRLKDEEMLVNYELAISKPNFLDNYQKKKKELENLMKSWEVLQEELESLN